MNLQPGTLRERALKLRLGLAGSPELAADLALDAEAHTLPEDIAQLRTVVGNLDLVLIVAHRGLSDALTLQLFGIDPSYRAALFNACHEAGVPIVFWRLDTFISSEHCRTIALSANAIFISDPSLADFGTNADVLPVGVQVGRYHPYMLFKEHVSTMARADLAYSGAAKNAEIASDLKFIDFGGDSATERANLFRTCLAVAVHASDHTPAEMAQLCLEASACGAIPILVGAAAVPLGLEGLYQYARDDGDVVRIYEDLLRDRLNARKLSHRIWRTVFKDHTLASRIDAIARTVGIHSGWEPYPLVTVFVPTFRTGLLDRCLSNYKKQNYPNLELIISLHSDAPPLEQISQITTVHSDVRVAVTPREESVGSVMNHAIFLANGKYCVKMDDDDYYGESYVLDMILPQRAMQIDLFGKPPAFTYFEASDQTVLRNPTRAKENCLVNADMLMSNDFRLTGSTHSGCTNFLRSVLFCERVRGAADTALYERCASVELTAASLDVFNTAAFRSADPKSHTWRLEDEKLIKGATHIGAGYRIETVEI